jgi:hypothetical protein
MTVPKSPDRVIDPEETVNESEKDGSPLWALVVTQHEREFEMGLILLALLVVLLFAGLGFALHLLWIIAAVLLVVWIIGFLVSGAEHSWYRVQRR